MSGLSKEARALIDAASQGDRPRPEDRARLRAMIAAQVAGPPATDPSAASTSGAGGAGGAASTSGAGGTAVGAASSGAAVVKIAVVAIALAGGAALLLPGRAPESSAVDPARVEVASPAVAPASASLSPAAEPASPLLAPAVAPASASPAPAVATVPASSPTDLQPAPERPDLTHPRARPARAARPARPERHDLEREAELIGAARVALREGDPARALDLADAHAGRFPQGALRNERLAARALALCALHRRLEARAARAELAAHSPGSALLDRVDRACAGVNPSDE
ncbi:MAG: hypothetical protein IT384_34270 [Deltaproteobacteria bacterium]|nr:hypothetical protein [Deltaproteobacteria bacterium]